MITLYGIKFLLLINIYYIRINNLLFTGKETVQIFFYKLHFHYVLSMGAVFALFAGFYYWTPKIVGRNINDFLGKIHF